MPTRFNLSQWARSLGWADAGFCRPEISELDMERFRKWLSDSKGPGLGYIERRKLERENPKLYFPQARTILVFSLSYFRGWAAGDVKVSSYAWGDDYHEVLRKKLEISMESLQNIFGSFQFRIAVDTAPLLEKVLAVKAGLGWQGKNSLLLSRREGSQLFLGEVLTDLDPELFEERKIENDHCGNCRRCIEACPTDALTPYSLNAEKCISYWNLEHKGAFDERTPSFHGWLAGCDICQQVCPWNAKLIATREPSVEENFFRDGIELTSVGSQEWMEKIQSTALNYVDRERWIRNREFMSQFE